jgi:hypothetical protein
MTANSQQRTHGPYLNPFAFPSHTDFRFILLILSVLAASLYIYSYLYLSFPSKQEASKRAVRSYQAVIATHPSQSDPDLQAVLQAEKQYLIPFDHNEALWISGCVILELSLAVVIFLAMPRWRIWHSRLRQLDASTMGDISEYLTNLCDDVGLSRHPKFLWQPSNPAKTGLAFGCLGWYYVALPAGLVQQFYNNRTTFHTIVLHELAHLRNKDVDKTYFTIAIWWAFILAALVPISPVILYGLYLEASLFFLSLILSNPSAYFTAPIHHSGLNEGWRIVALTLLVYLTRNAVLRVREVYADVRAATWDRQSERFVHILQAFPPLKGGRWLRPWRVHPDPQERIQILNDPTRVFYLGFWDAFSTGVAAMIAFPSFADYFSLFHIPGSIGGTGVAAVVGAGLVFAPLIAGVLSLGVWRATLFKLVYRETSTILIQLTVGLGLGMLLGQILSLQDYLLTLFFKYSQNFIVHFSFDVVWGILLLVSLLLFIRWLVAGVSTWLDVAIVSPSPAISYWVSSIIPGSVLAVWIGLLYGFRFLSEATLSVPTVDNLITFFNTTTEFPLTLFVFISLWAYPLAPWFWRKQTGQNTNVGWVFLGASQRLIPPSRSPLSLRIPIISGVLSGLTFSILLLIIRILVNLIFPQAVQQTEAFYMLFGYSIVGISIVLQTIAAAVTASLARRVSMLQGLFAAFITGCIATIGQIVVFLVFAHHQPSITEFWITVQTYFGLFVNGGALLALPVSLMISALARLARQSQ